MNIAMAKLNM